MGLCPGTNKPQKALVREMSERSLGGQMLSGGERPSRSFGRNRVCRQVGCTTKLSMYNNGKYCFQHEPMAVPRTRGKKIA
jgi:hypothetical protein